MSDALAAYPSQVDLPRSDRHVPGTWKELRIFDQGTPCLAATITCPECGQVGVLFEHAISADGAVTPSVACPAPGCGYHAHVRLAGWEHVSLYVQAVKRNEP